MTDPHDLPRDPAPASGPAPGDPLAAQSPPEAAPTSEERTMAMLAHLVSIVSSFIGPLIIWLIKKDESKYVDWHGKECLNFQITLVIAWIIAAALTCVVVGVFIMPVLAIVGLVLPIIAGIKANDGQRWRYPATLRLIK